MVITKKLSALLLLLLPFPLFGQATTGYHRIAQVISRGNFGVDAQIVPNAKVSVTLTSSGSAATIYSDALLSSPVLNSVVTSDLNGNYGYYIPLNECVTEHISYPGAGALAVPNVCNNSSSSLVLQTNGTNNSNQNLLNLVAGVGVVLSNIGGAVTINAPNAVGVSSINSVGGAFSFVGGGVACAGTTCTFSGSGNPVTSFNAFGYSPLTGGVVLACGTGLTCSQSGQTITVSASAAFAINSFTGCSTVELGTSLVNPTFTAVYTTTPASANITNTEGISSPTNLTPPYTSGTIAGTFVHSAIENTTFTLSATQGTTQTASCTDSWQPAIFAGAGAAGATASVVASGTTAVLSNGAVLPRDQLGAEIVGTTFSPPTLSGQNVYLFLTGAGHTFIDANTGFPFAFNTPTTVSFTNAEGTTITMYLYQSTNALYGTYRPKVAS